MPGGRAVSAAEHERLRRDFAALTRPVRGRQRGALGHGPLGRRPGHGPHDHRRERPPAVPVAGRPALPARGRRLPADQGGRAVRGVDPATSPSTRCRWTAATLIGRVGLDRTTQQIADVLADPDYGRHDLQRVGGFRTTMGAPMLLDDEVVGALARLAQRGQPVRRARDGHRHRVRRPGGDGGQRREARAAAGGPGRRAGAARSSELEALREVGEAVSSSLDVDNVLSTIAKHAVELSGDRRRLDHGVRRATTAASWSAASTGPTRASIERLRSIRIDLDETLVGRAAKRAPADRRAGPRRRRPRPAPADPVRRRLAVAGRRTDAARGPDRRLADRPPQADRRLLRGDRRPAGDVRQPVGAGAAERAAVPRAEGAERSSWSWPAGTSPSSWRACRTSCGRRSTPSSASPRCCWSGCSATSTSARRSTCATSTARASTCSSC